MTNKTDRLLIRINPELKARLEAHAAANAGSVAAHVRQALTKYLNEANDLTARVERLERFARTIPN